MRIHTTALALLLLLATTCLHAQVPPYTMLFVFGDSYSDSGAGYIDGDGPTAVVYLAQRLGIPFTWFGDPQGKGKGLNFAVSGAQTGVGEGRRYPHGELLGRGMGTQVADFARLVRSGDIRFDPARTVFFLAGGLNDRSLPDGTTSANLQADIDVLYGAGARRFQLALLPVAIPAFTTAGQRANPQIEALPAIVIATHPDASVTLSQWGPFFDQVIGHPALYGLTDVTGKCAGRTLRDEDPTPCATPRQHFYYHEGHPSTAAHRAVGDLLYGEAMGAGSRSPDEKQPPPSPNAAE